MPPLNNPQSEIALVLSFEFPPYPGGIGTVACHLAQEFHRTGIPLAVMTKPRRTTAAADSAFEHGLPFPVHHFGQRETRAGNLLGCILDTVRFCLRRKVRWIFCATHREAYGALVCRHLFGIPFFIYGHGSEYTRPSWRKGRILDRARRLFANSAYTAGLMRQLTRNPVMVVPPGVDTDVFDPRRTSPDFAIALRVKYGIQGGPVLLSVGRLNRRKGHDITLRALSRIREEFPEVRLVLIGRSMHGAEPYEQFLRELTRTHNLEANVFFLPPVSPEELRGFYCLADVYILASRRDRGEAEGFGIVLLEANAMEVPVVASDSGGVSDAVEDGKSGFLFREGDPDELAVKVLHLLRNPELRCIMGGYGRCRTCDGFTWKTIGGRILEEIVQKCEQGQM